MNRTREPKATAPRGGGRLHAGPNGTGADAAAGRGRRAGQRAVADTTRTGVVEAGAAGAGTAACVAVAGVAVVDATQQSLVTITGADTTVAQPQPVWQ